MYDVIIIGAGIIGAATARELAKYKLNILVLEKGADVSCGASKANSGIIHAGYDCVPNSLKAKFNMRGSSLYKQLVIDLDIPYRNNGSMVLAFNKEEVSALLRLKKQGEENGIQDLSVLNPRQILSIEPHINPLVASALYAPSASIISPFEATIGFAESAYANGVRFTFNTEVIGINLTDGIFEVRTSARIFKAKTIVNAAGLYSDTINNLVNEEKYRITPVKGEYLLLDKSAKYITDKTLFKMPSAMGKGVLVLPTVHDNILIGPSADFIENKADVSTGANILKTNTKTAKTIIPALPLQYIITSFAGLRAREKNSEDFIVSNGSAKGFVNAVGINSPGLSAAPAIAEHICGLITEYLNPKVNADFIKERIRDKVFTEQSFEEQKRMIAHNPNHGKIVCRCEQVTEADIRNAIRSKPGATTIDGIKFRARAGSGRCQGGFCSLRVIEILAEELGISPEQVTKSGGQSYVLEGGCACENC